MSDIDKLNLIREAMPVTQNKIYLNAGVIGPLTTIASEALKEANERELKAGRAGLSAYKAKKRVLAKLRHALANLLKAAPEEIALTRSTTEGMNIVSHGLNWQPGDEAITTDLEHPGALLPLYVLRQRRGVEVKFVEIPPDIGMNEVVARFEAAITPRTRLLSFSHVAWNSGMRLPLAEIVAMAHRHQVLCLVDGAQSAGAIPLDLPASGVDFYAVSGQKWLCGPEGTGALYIRPEYLSLVSPTFAGFSTMGEAGIYDLSGHYMPAPNASRYEVGNVYRPAIQAQAVHLSWLEEVVGWEWIYARIAQLVEYGREALSRLSGVSLITPPGAKAGLLTFNLDGYDPPRVVARLDQEDIILRYLADPYYALRISIGFYNTEVDLDRLVTALQAILSSDPESLPPYEL